MKKYFIVIPFLFSLTTFAASSNKCADVFANAPAFKAGWKQFEEFRAYNNELNPQNLKKAGFRIENDKLYEIDKGPDAMPVGVVKVAESSHLFEWADKETKASWSPGGLTDKYMKMALKAPGQAAGKGFYVSMDPVDSYYYGDALTSFKTSGPILVLEVKGHYTADVSQDTAFVTRLANAGIDGIRTTEYTKTWLSMISNRHLKEVTDLPLDAIVKTISAYTLEKNNNRDHIMGLYSFLKQVPPEVWRTFPKTNIFRRLFLREQIKSDEIVALLKDDLDLQGAMLEGLLKDFSFSRNPEEALYYLGLLKDLPNADNVPFLMDKVMGQDFANNSKFRYKVILSLFDLKTVATTQNIEGLKKVAELFVKEGFIMTPETKAELEALAEKQKVGSIRYIGNGVSKLTRIFSDMQPTSSQRKKGQVEMLATILNEWTASAKNDVEFFSRSQWSLEFFFRMYPEYRVPFLEGEAS